MIFWSIAIILGSTYFAISLAAFLCGIDPLLFALTIPWSMLISLLSNLIVHMSVDGESYIDAGMLGGSALNVLIFWFVCYLARLEWQTKKL